MAQDLSPTQIQLTQKTPLRSFHWNFLHEQFTIKKDDPSIEGLHIHVCFEIYLNISGNVSFLVNNTVYRVPNGSIILSPPHFTHHCIYNISGLVEHCVLWISDPKHLPLLDFTREKDFSPIITFSDKDKDRFIDIIYLLKKCLNDQDIKKNSSLTSLYIFQLLTMIAEQYYSPNCITSIEDKTLNAFNKTLQEIDKYYLDYHSAEEIAKLLFVSKSTLNRLFRKYLHISPKEYLTHKKLAYARFLLSKDYSIDYIAIKTGFYDSSHFISVFKQYFGETPFRYKSNIKQPN